MMKAPQDSVLRRHYDQLQQVQTGPGMPPAAAGSSSSADTGRQDRQKKGFLAGLLARLFGN